MKTFLTEIITILTLCIMLVTNTNTLTVPTDGIAETLDLNLPTHATLQRGFQIIDGNIHDKYGNLFMTIDEYGFNPQGFQLSPTFFISYDNSAVSNSNNSVSIFNGTQNLRLNTNGSQGTQLGSDFTVTGTDSSVKVTYSSGIPTGVNFSLNNVTRNVNEGWFINIQPGNSATFETVFNPNDTFRILASAVGRAGSATARVDVVTK